MGFNQVGRRSVVPCPLAADGGRWGDTAQFWVWFALELTEVEERYKVTPNISLFVRQGSNMDGIGSEAYPASKLRRCHFFYAVLDGLLEANDSSRYMPGRTIELIISPSQECLPHLVFYQKINVNERRQTTHEVKNLLGEPDLGIRNMLHHLIEQS
jgi:hypothetical protein